MTRPWRQTLERCGHKPRNAGRHRKWEEARGRSSRGASRGNAALPAARFQLSETDFSEIINFCCFQPLNWCEFVPAAIGNQCRARARILRDDIPGTVKGSLGKLKSEATGSGHPLACLHEARGSMPCPFHFPHFHAYAFYSWAVVP